MIPNPFLNTNEHRPRSLWRILIFMLLFIVLLGFSSLIESEFLKYAYMMLVTAGLIYIQYRYIDKRSMDEGGIIISSKWIQDVGWGSLFGLVAVAFIFLVEWAFGMLTITDFEWTRLNTDYLAILVFLFQMISVGFYEEVAFRGVIMKNMSEGFQFDKIGVLVAVWIAIILSSSLFGIGHINNPNATWISSLYIVFAGVMLAVPYILTGSLAIPVGIHLSWNFALGGVFGFKVSGQTFQHSVIHIRQTGYEVWTGGDFGPEAGILGIFGMAIIILLCLWFSKWKDGALVLHESFSKTYDQKFPALGSVDASSENQVY